jgi:hypothetical protein
LFSLCQIPVPNDGFPPLNQKKEIGGWAFFYKCFTPAGGDEQIELWICPGVFTVTVNSTRASLGWQTRRWTLQIRGEAEASPSALSRKMAVDRHRGFRANTLNGHDFMKAGPENKELDILRWREREPIFGRVSLWMLGAAAAIIVWAIFGPRGTMRSLVVALYVGGLMCMANVGIATVGLARRENPRWPAVTGLLLSLLPAIGGIYLLCGAPW